MRTRSQSREQPPPPEGPPVVIEPLRIEYPFQEDPTVEPMADTRTMAQLLQAPTEGYEDAILIPEIVANNFELRHGLINLVQNKQFFGHDKEDPHAHIRYFNKITSTMRVPNVPITTIKLMLFPFSIEGAARIWLEKEPPRSIQTWDDLVSKFINQFFPPSKTTNLRNEITRFQQRFIELLLRGSGNILTKLPRECLKSSRAIQVRQTLARGSVVPRVSNKLFHPSCFIELLELKGIPQEVLGFYRYNPSEIPLQAILNSEPTLPPSSKELSPPKSELSLKALETNTATSPLMNQLRINEEVRGEGGKWGGGRRMGAEEEGKRGREEGKGEKRKREVDTSKRTENQANDKTEHGRKRQCKNQGQKSQNAKVKSIPEESAVKPEP
ncbi:reverse transcriptase domain-containing protein [Tanacetum coccineum]